MVIAAGHSVVVAELAVFVVTAGHDTSVGEPGPRSGYLTTVAALGAALEEVAAAGCVGD